LNTPTKKLYEFWEEMKKSKITLSSVEKLQDLLSNVFIKISELEKSRDKWKSKYYTIKNREKKK
jgi:hypothetical protein